MKVERSEGQKDVLRNHLTDDIVLGSHGWSMAAMECMTDAKTHVDHGVHDLLLQDMSAHQSERHPI